MIQCSNCGTYNADNVQRCAGCGAELTEGNRIVIEQSINAVSQSPRETRLDNAVQTPAKHTVLDVEQPTPIQPQRQNIDTSALFDGRYRMVEIIGKGGFSEVWLAEDTLATNQQVALKLYKSDFTAQGVAQFSREFARMLNCNHTNLLTPKHYGIVNGTPYLELAYCSYGSVEKLIGRISEAEAWKLIRDVASGLAYLHGFLNEEGTPSPMVHQDIKPDNILIDQQGNYVITDFGISTQIRATMRRSALNVGTAGTSAYMAPERFHGQPQPIKANDIWSLGATLFELVEGVSPLGDGGGSVQKEGIQFQFNSDISNDLKRVICDCLAIDPTRRPAADELAEYASKKAQGQYAEMTWKKRKRQHKKGNRIVLWLFITLVVLCLAAGGVYLYSQQHPITVQQNYMMGKQLYDDEKYEDAIPYLEKAVSKGHDMAQWLLGRCYLDGTGVAQSEDSAFVLFSKSAQAQNPLGQYEYAHCLLWGNGTKQDTNAANQLLVECFREFEKSIDQDSFYGSS